MRIDSDGNVGIGVTPKSWSVGTALEVARNGSAIWSNGQGETNIMANIYYDGGYKYAATGAYGARINVGNTNGNILFYTDASSGTAGSTSGATESMRIDSSGNVGIGVSPESTSKLHIKETTKDAKVTIETADAYDSFINFSAASAEYSIGYDRTDSSFKFCLANNITSNEHMRITSGGDVLVGTDDVNGSASNGYDIVAGRHATVRGSVLSATTGTAYTMFDVPNYSVWLVTAFVPAASNSYNETALVHSNVGAVSVSVLVNGGNIQISNSGASIQVTQTSGATQNISYSAIRIA